MSASPNVTKALKWARETLQGKHPACLYIHQQIQRHFDDVKKSASKDFPYKFCRTTAERKLKLHQLLPHTKGEWARRGELLTLEPWQLFGLACMYGWVRKRSGLRRFREAYWEIPRKNGKSALAAAVGHVMFWGDGEFGAEVYSGATTEKQAWEVFRPARLMAVRSPDLQSAVGMEVNASNLSIPKDGSRFEPIIGSPGDGASPSCALIDEYHEHKTDDLYETMLTGMGSRQQPLMLIITTAGADIGGPCYAKRQECIEMLSGVMPDEELFAWIWTIDEGDDWTDPAVLAKANPNFGVSVYEEYLLSMQQRGIRTPRFTNTFKNKHLNVWTTGKSNYFNMVDWLACEDRTLTLEQFEGELSILSLDLARKLDMNSMARLFWRVDQSTGLVHYYSVAPKFWVPEDTVSKNESKRVRERYETWVNTGHLYETPGAEIDYREITAEIVGAREKNPVHEIPLDPSGATALSHALEDEGFSPISITQNFTFMSDPMKELEAAITSGRFHHDGNPIMTWCMSNVIGRNLPGNDDVVRPVRQGQENKIDGAVTLIMAVGRAMAAVRSNETNEEEDFFSAIRNPIIV